MRLTDLGNTIAGELDTTSWAKRTAEGLRDQAKGKRPYEIQEFCFEYVSSDEFRPSDDLTVAIETCAYDHGIDDDQVRTVLAITLRDELLTTAAVNA